MKIRNFEVLWQSVQWKLLLAMRQRHRRCKRGGGVISPQTEYYKHMELLWEQTKCTSSFFMPHWEKKKTSTAIFSNTTGQAAADRMYPAKPWSFKVGFDVCLDE